ncbi:translation elongation factor Ts (EF-Ts) [Hydrobacter penzbergensis]|jgi:elongation factor Ts|uniref:Elongation factor Ts n=1 Tax=Hydrobacter penzbergensis TaxID=1235997 RepID=A0A8X8IHN6_9BACT|nr:MULTISPECIES: translation elongation factor Ts [Chitinophagaceae]MBN8719520.1 elongation factor Ts [Sediminibacterium magnilacihabitans]PQV60474.1 translation elongation factor Ts (EF-Ts) [Sediminibacterium magnilacihabitans]SDX58054.1 translation elongation factor Ts (EF-Ts) [Hydrobacter penzbergensis]
MSTATITAAEINKLRQATGAGMMDCRKALTETNGDFEAAIDWLRKQGQKVAAKRSDREAKEGVIIAKTSADNKTGFIVCISCETDFVSKNADFVAFAQSIADAAVANNVNSAEELNEVVINGAKVSDLINDKLAAIGEKIGVAKFEKIEAPYVASYIHGAYRMGVLVGLSSEAAEAGKDIAMQIAAMNPVAVDADSVPADVIERERAIIVDTMKQDPKMAGKPDEMISKIAEGKLNAFFKEQTLLAQAFVKDGGKSVGEYLKSVGADLKVTGFKRVALG